MFGRRGPDPLEDNIKRGAFSERVALAYRLTPPTLMASIIPSLVMWLLVRSIFPGPGPTRWFLAMCITTIGRYALVLSYRHWGASHGQPGQWAGAYVIGALCAGSLLGYAGVAFFPFEHPVYQGVITAILVGVSSGGSSLGVILPSYVAYLVPIMLPFGFLMIFPRGHRVHAPRDPRVRFYRHHGAQREPRQPEHRGEHLVPVEAGAHGRGGPRGPEGDGGDEREASSGGRRTGEGRERAGNSEGGGGEGQ